MVSLQLEKKKPEPYQGGILFFNDRFPPRAFTVTGAALKLDRATVEAALSTGRYNGTFDLGLLSCPVQIQSFEGDGTYDAATGTLKGWYQLSYSYVGANAARCREMLGELRRDTGVMLGRKPAFGGQRVEFSGQIDSLGYGKVKLTFPDGTTGELDVTPLR